MHLDATDIQRALEQDEIFPVFQPLVELRTGQLAGFEVLARWHHAELGEIPPDQFISQCEASGCIDHLTQTILEKAFSSEALLRSSLSLSVNLSPLQLQNAALPARIAACAQRRGFSLDRLTIEITESALLSDLTRAAAVAHELKTLHCNLALDDFGTGYSSLKNLQALPFDELKVDRTFVSSMTRARESRKIVAAVIGLGLSLGLRTVAEGIETPEEASMLIWLGCDMGQGWLYGRPAPAAEIRRMLSTPPQTYPTFMPAASDAESIMRLDWVPVQRLAQLQAVYDGAPVGLCFLDRNLRYVSLNRRLAIMNGAPAAAHLGRTVEEVLPRLFPQVEPYIRRALAGEPIAGVELEDPASEDGGEVRTILVSYQPARDEAGEVLGVSVAVMDITERKRTEEALRESEDHFRHLMELGPHVPWVLNTKGEVIEASPRWEEVTGQPLQDAIGHGWQKMLHPDDVPATVEAIHASLSTGKPIDVHYRVRKPQGGWQWMRSRGSARFGPSGEVIGVYGVVEEVQRPAADCAQNE